MSWEDGQVAGHRAASLLQHAPTSTLWRAAASLPWGLPPALPAGPGPHFSPACCPQSLLAAVLGSSSDMALPCPATGPA